MLAKVFRSQKGVVQNLVVLLVIAAMGILSFLIISSTAPFSNKLTETIYNKAETLASGNFIANPGCETNTAGWTALQGALSRSTNSPHSGVASCNVIYGGTGGFFVLNDSPNTINKPEDNNLAAGSVYTATAWVKTANAPGKPAQIVIRQIGPNSNKTTTSTAVSLSGTWQKITVTATIDPGITSLDINVFQNNAVSGNAMQIDDITLTSGSVVAPKLVGFWKFDENMNYTSKDFSAFNNTATLNGPVWTAGKFGSGLMFDGVNDYVATGTNSLNLNDFTIALWVKIPSTSTGDGYVYTTSDNNTNYYTNRVGIRVTGGRIYGHGWFNSVGYVVGSASTYNNDSWHHVAFTRSGSTWSLYVDGVLTDASVSKSSTRLITNWSTIGSLRYGPNQTLLLPFNGSIDDVQIYDGALDPMTIASLAAPTPTPPSDPGLVGYWKFDDRSGTSVLDSSGSNNTGTLINSPTWIDGKFNGALSFDGTNDYVSVANNTKLNLTGPLTLSAWVNLRATGVQYWVMGKSVVNSHPGTYSLYISPAGKTCAQLYNGLIRTSCGTTTIPTGSWHYLVGVYDGSNLRVYFDGQPEGTPIAITSYSTNSDPIGIGGLSDAQWLNGSIDNIKIYNYARSVAQIGADMTNP